MYLSINIIVSVNRKMLLFDSHQFISFIVMCCPLEKKLFIIIIIIVIIIIHIIHIKS